MKVRVFNQIGIRELVKKNNCLLYQVEDSCVAEIVFQHQTPDVDFKVYGRGAKVFGYVLKHSNRCDFIVGTFFGFLINSNADDKLKTVDVLYEDSNIRFGNFVFPKTKDYFFTVKNNKTVRRSYVREHF